MRRILTLLFIAALLLTPGYAPSAHAHSSARPSAQVATTGTVIKTANLRAGPGTTFAIVGSAQAGQPVTILGTNAAGDWYQIGEGRWIAAFLVRVASAPSAASVPSGLVEAIVTKVIDGDTIHVLIGGVDSPLRYIGVDSPESSDPLFGAKATEANRKLVEGQKVYLESDVSDVDRYARLLRYVYLADGRMVNEVLAEQGWAYAKAYAPDTKYQSRLVAAQGRGVTAKAGMWEIVGDEAVLKDTRQRTRLILTHEGFGNLFDRTCRAAEGWVFLFVPLFKRFVAQRNSVYQWRKLAAGKTGCEPKKQNKQHIALPRFFADSTGMGHWCCLFFQK